MLLLFVTESGNGPPTNNRNGNQFVLNSNFLILVYGYISRIIDPTNYIILPLAYNDISYPVNSSMFKLLNGFGEVFESILSYKQARTKNLGITHLTIIMLKRETS